MDGSGRPRVRSLSAQHPREPGPGRFRLVELSDLELAKALGAVEANGAVTAIRVLGLLLFGRESSLREFLPAHEVAFQALTGTAVEANEFFRWPLLRTMEAVLERLRARNREQEVHVGLLRVPVPEYPERALREAVANAMVYRDYTRLGAVHIQWREDHLEVSNPGGFPEGVTLKNLLVTPPRPRNLLLADAFKRAGLVERTARGIDTIFEEQMVLQYLATHQRIARRDVSDLCKISPNQSRSLISKLLKSGRIVQRGHKRGAFYERPA